MAKTTCHIPGKQLSFLSLTQFLFQAILLTCPVSRLNAAAVDALFTSGAVPRLLSPPPNTHHFTTSNKRNPIPATTFLSRPVISPAPIRKPSPPAPQDMAACPVQPRPTTRTHKTCRTEAAPFPRPFTHFHLTTKMQTPVLSAVLPRRNAASHRASGWQRRDPVRPQIEVRQTSPSRMHSCCRHILNEAGQRCIPTTYLGLVCTIWYL